MAEIRALIVDDEPLARRGIRQLLAAYPDIVVAAECRDGREALRALAALDLDLVFLDIQMPGLDGFAVIRTHGPERMPATVFITAHDAFAVRAFQTQALDYLVKPLGEARFRATITRVRERIRTADAVARAERLAALLHGLAVDQPAPPIAVPTPTGERLLDPGEIDWLQADGNHTQVHGGTAVWRIREPLSALEARLAGGRFVRIHRGTVVRLGHVRELRVAPGERDGEVILRDGRLLQVSRRRLPGVRALLRSRGGG